MAKRTATRELNHDNWDDDEEAEEAGTFQKASEEKLQGRVIKQARRRLGASEEGAKKGFTGFSGFGAPKAPSSNVFGNLTFAKQQEPETKSTSTFTSLVFTKQTTETSTAENGGSKLKNVEDSPSEKEYLASLKALNESVSVWISDHVKKNPYCVLTPVFKDYEKHLQDLESKRAAGQPKGTSAILSMQPEATPTEKSDSDKKTSLFSFGKTDSDDKAKTSDSKTEASKPGLNFFGSSTAPPASSTTTTPSSTGFSFGLKTTSSPASTFSFGASSSATTPSTSAPPPFSFKSPTSSTTTTATTSSLFTFGSAPPGMTASSTGFSFGFSSAKPPEKKEDEEKDEGDGDEDEPPKVEVKQVQEDDAFYSVKCKLFYKKEGNFVEKGVGMLHLKKIKDDKTQLVIRADTSLGNILLNILLHPQLTTQRVGKNNVMMVCIPNPPIDPKTAPVPTPMLLRVKTDTEADELLQKLNDAKK